MSENPEGLKRLGKLRDLCDAHKLELIVRANGHIQVKGAYLVNYYPFAKKPTIYIAGTAGKSTYNTPEEVVRLAVGHAKTFKVEARDKRPKNTQARKKRLWAAGCKSCHWCKVEFERFEDATLEHIIPLSKGGLDNPNNTTLAHAKCNNDRGNLLPHKGLRLVVSRTGA